MTVNKMIMITTVITIIVIRIVITTVITIIVIMANDIYQITICVIQPAHTLILYVW